MGIVEYIAIVIVAFILAAGIYYVYLSLLGPRKTDDIEKLLSSGRIQAAIDELHKILDKDEWNQKARFLLARAYRKLGKYGNAVAELRQSLKAGKFGPEIKENTIRSLLAHCLLDGKNYNEAKNEFLLLTSKAPRDFENFFQVGKLYLQSGDANRGAKFLSMAIKLNDRHAESLALLGQALYAQKSYQGARAALMQAVQLQADDYTAHYFLGLCLRYMQDPEWAVKEFEIAQKDPGIRVKAIMGKGMSLIDQQSFPHAVSALEKGLRFVDEGSDTEINMRYLLALAAEKCRDMHIAIASWELIEKKRPGFRDVKEKLVKYADYRIDDSIKDFMIASNQKFEEICRGVIAALGYQIVQFRIVNDALVQAQAIEEGSAKRNVRKSHILVHINRDNVSSLSESAIREFHDAVKDQNAGRGLMLTAGEISAAAIAYASSRPIELFDMSRLSSVLREVMEKSTGGTGVSKTPVLESPSAQKVDGAKGN